jgi:hypothetical protein
MYYRPEIGENKHAYLPCQSQNSYEQRMGNEHRVSCERYSYSDMGRIPQTGAISLFWSKTANETETSSKYTRRLEMLLCKREVDSST